MLFFDGKTKPVFSNNADFLRYRTAKLSRKWQVWLRKINVIFLKN
jgi:hypothetical protein